MRTVLRRRNLLLQTLIRQIQEALRHSNLHYRDAELTSYVKESILVWLRL